MLCCLSGASHLPVYSSVVVLRFGSGHDCVDRSAAHRRHDWLVAEVFDRDGEQWTATTATASQRRRRGQSWQRDHGSPVGRLSHTSSPSLRDRPVSTRCASN